MVADKNNPDSKDGSILLRINPFVEKNRLIHQLGTGEAKLVLEAATKVINGVKGIDVNKGYPRKSSIGGGIYSALLNDMRCVCDII